MTAVRAADIPDLGGKFAEDRHGSAEAAGIVGWNDKFKDRLIC